VKKISLKFGPVAVVGKALTMVALLAGCAIMASATDYYVSSTGSDSNPGTSAAPFKTIQKAAGVATAGSTVHVLPGTYNTTSTITTSRSGTDAAHIRFLSTVQWGAKIVSKMGKTTSTTWSNTGSYVDFVGFDLTGDGNEGFLNYGSYVSFIGNHVHNYPGSSVCGSNTGAGINAGTSYTGHNNSVIGNVVHDIGTPAKCNFGQGIYVANPYATVSNNVSYHNGAYGLCFWHAATEEVISSNLVFGNGLGGIWVGASYGSVSFSYSTISNNIIVSNQASGVSGYGIRNGGGMGTHNQFLNNIIYGNVIETSGITATGTIAADPQFVSPTGNFMTGNYHVKSTSPAINKGTSIGAPTIDFDGGLRPSGGGWDIGAYQNSSTAAQWPYEM